MSVLGGNEDEDERTRKNAAILGCLDLASDARFLYLQQGGVVRSDTGTGRRRFGFVFFFRRVRAGRGTSLRVAPSGRI